MAAGPMYGYGCQKPQVSKKKTAENKPRGLLNQLSDIPLAPGTTARKPQIESFALQLLRMFCCVGSSRSVSICKCVCVCAWCVCVCVCLCVSRYALALFEVL